MQLYTKILIGMAVGVILGILVGPSSSFLPADLYTYRDASQANLYVDRFDPASQVTMPKGSTVNLELLSLKYSEKRDNVGEMVDVPQWAEVRLKWNRSLAIRDAHNVVREKLGVEEVGDTAVAWLKLRAEPLPSGGFAVNPAPVASIGVTVMSWVRPVGTVFIRLIKMVIVPLVFASLLVGVASLGDVRKLGRLGGKTVGLYLVTTGIAVSIGLAVANLLKPGNYMGEAARASLVSAYKGAAGQKVTAAAAAPSLLDNVINIIPSNPFGSLASGDASAILQVIFFALVFGVALTLLDGTHGRPVVTFFDRVQQAMILIIHMVMKLAPYGVAALVADVVGGAGLSILQALFAYTMVVLIGLLIHGVFVYGALVQFYVRMPIPDFLRAIRPAQLISFSTSSSSATLPVSMECAQQNLGASKSVSSFVLPLGSTVNMDGTALYQGVAAVFIAQVFDMDLSFTSQLGIVATATMASIGAAGVPGAGIVTLALVLTSVGIPAEGVALILGMDRLLDMCRTTVNVTGDLAVTAAMAVSEGEKLRVLTPEADEADPDRGFEGRLDGLHEHPVQPE